MANLDFYFPLDTTGLASTNRVTAERHTLESGGVRLVIPKKGVFFSATMAVNHVDAQGVVKHLVRGVDFVCVEFLAQTTYALGKEIHAAVLVINPELTAWVDLTYQGLGGPDNVDRQALAAAYALVGAEKPVLWEDVIHPTEFPAAAHQQDSTDLYGMEFVKEAIDRLTQAVSIGDEAFHRQLKTTDYAQQASRFFTTFNTSFNSALDLVYLHTESSDTSLKVVGKSLEDVDSDAQASDALDAINQRLLQEHRFCFDHFERSCAVSYLAQKQLEKKGTLMEVPKHLNDLYLWLDFSDTSKVRNGYGEGFVITDKSYYAREFTSVGVSLTDSSLFGLKGADFVSASHLNLTKGGELVVPPVCTIAFVTTRLGATMERIQLLKSAGAVLSVDIQAGLLAQLSVDGQTVVEAGGDRRDNYTAHLVVLCLNTPQLESGCFSNSPRSVYRDHYGLNQVSSFASQLFTQIGFGVQSCKLMELAIYHRQLSKPEVQALGTYFDLKYGLEFNLLANGNMNDALAEFETDYTLSMEAPNKGEICSFMKENVGTQSGIFAKFFVIPNYSTITRQMPARNKFMMINTALDPERSIRRDVVKLSPYTSYEYAINVLYNPENPPRLVLRVNGVKIGNTYQLSSGESKRENVTFTFKTGDVREAVVELFNINTEGEINTFGIDMFRLIRAPIARSIT